MDEKVEEIGGDIGDMKGVVTGLNNKYHVISRTMNYQLIGIGLLVLLAIFGLLFLMR